MEKENGEAASNMLVAVRIRPLSNSEVESGQRSCCTSIGDKVIAIKKNGDAGGYLKSQQPIVNEYAFDEVFDNEVDQVTVYNRTAKSFIPHLLDGHNVTVFAYGATGAGKTHTMLGNTRADSAAANAEAGIIPNSVKDLFSLLRQKKRLLNYGESYKVFASFLEVYNEQVYDLLESSGKILSVREDKDKGIVVAAGLTEIEVTEYEDVHELILQGNRQRKTEATMANQVSSRSHAILQLNVRHVQRLEGGRESIQESKLALIDLAGSERASATNNRGARLQEGANINKSLLALANCINALAENANSKKAGNVKYRDSKLTHLLRSSLEGNGFLVMIANINPSDLTYEDSHNTLKYANRAKNIKINPLIKETQVKDSNWVEREMKLREENTHLKAVIQKLEKQVAELQKFKNSVLAAGGGARAGVIESQSDFSFANTDAMDTKHDIAENTSAFDDSISSMSTAMDTATTEYASSASDIMPTYCEEEPVFLPKKTPLPVVESVKTNACCKPFGFVQEATARSVDTAAEVAQGIAGTKRRASLLPTYKGSVKVSRRHSLDLKAISDKMNAVVASIGLDAVTPVLRTSSVANSPPAPPMEIPPSPVANREPIHLERSMEEDPSENWLGRAINFDLGAKTVSEPPAVTHAAAAPIARRASMRTSISAISRRKSIAQVTAMLDSLQNNVVGSCVSASMQPVPASIEANKLAETIHEASKEEETAPAKPVQVKVLQVVDPNTAHATAKEAKEEKNKKVSANSRRKSCAVKKENTLVSLGTVDGKKDDVEKENGQPEGGLRRSKSRASMALGTIREAWVDV
eukprot:gene22261-27223_t